MSQLETIEAEIQRLPRTEAEQLQDWLAEYLEERAEINPDFAASIERGQTDLRDGRVRKVQP
jgi:mRNA-degrading endonuclease RelE of RelBE toxin-antitoxin system